MICSIMNVHGKSGIYVPAFAGRGRKISLYFSFYEASGNAPIIGNIAAIYVI